MPELKINVLVYAEKPEDRFLLINGQRLVEKEELTDGIVLDEIRRDGAVFRYKKYRFLVKG
jgi:general secretion pathway protein B